MASAGEGKEREVEASAAVRVCVRFRPPNKIELESGGHNVVKIGADGEGSVKLVNETGQVKGAPSRCEHCQRDRVEAIYLTLTLATTPKSERTSTSIECSKRT